MSVVYSFQLPVPPSLNHLYTVARGRKILSGGGRDYKIAVRNALNLTRPFPSCGDSKLSMTLRFFFPDRRRRDSTNFVKILEDSLKECGVYGDDSQIYEHHLYKTLGCGKPGHVQVDLEVLNDD